MEYMGKLRLYSIIRAHPENMCSPITYVLNDNSQVKTLVLDEWINWKAPK